MTAILGAGVADREVTVWQDRVTMTVREAGDGSPLVFFHNAAGLQWDPLLDDLAAAHHVYAPMHPGTDGVHHDAVRPLRTIWDLVLCYADLFDALELEHATLVGHSFGAMVAAEVAATYPAFADRLVLISPMGLWRDDAPLENWMARDPRSVTEAMFADPDGPLAQGGVTVNEAPNASMGPRSRAENERLARTRAMELDPKAAAEAWWIMACTGHFIWPLPEKGLRTRIHRIDAPTLVVWGREDGIVPVVYADEFGRLIRDARVEVVENAGHVPHLEQPELVRQIVRDFLTG